MTSAKGSWSAGPPSVVAPGVPGVGSSPPQHGSTRAAPANSTARMTILPVRPTA